MRKLVALTLLLVPAIACAEWSDADRALHYLACREAGGTPNLCACIMEKLQEIQPDPAKLEGDNIAEAVKACVLPPNTANTVSI